MRSWSLPARAGRPRTDRRLKGRPRTDRRLKGRPRTDRRIKAAAVVVAAGLLAPVAALAQATGPQPVLDDAPWKVGYERTAVIKGHLESGVRGAEVTLERRKPGAEWRALQTKRVDRRKRVTFFVKTVRSNAFYRLAYLDETTQTTQRSRIKEIRVSSELALWLAPDHVYTGNPVKVHGHLLPRVGSRTVRLEQRIDGQWRSLGRVRVRDGRFSARFKPFDSGYRKIRARFMGDRVSLRTARGRGLHVYRRDVATWYGPGFYGNSTACGRTLTPETLGVAHRTLPCGTQVSIMFRGRTISVPVIDRGPYSSANWDLTQETAERLRFEGRQTVGVTR